MTEEAELAKERHALFFEKMQAEGHGAVDIGMITAHGAAKRDNPAFCIALERWALRWQTPRSAAVPAVREAIRGRRSAAACFYPHAWTVRLADSDRGDGRLSRLL